MDGGSAGTRRAGSRLTGLVAGMPIVYGGDRVTTVPAALAEAFRAGDRLVVVQETGDLLHVPAADQAVAADAVERAAQAFAAMGRAADERITDFFHAFAERLEDEAVWTAIAEANAADVAAAQAKGRSTTRLAVTAAMRADMAAGLRAWAEAPAGREEVVETVQHPGWRLELRKAALGVVGFVFEGRPNVFADAAGVLRGGNTVVFRIGSDALGTARAIMAEAVAPALRDSGLPPGAMALLDSSAHAAGWALFADPRLSLAVARGSGPAVAQLGAIARQAGTPVSLHGTGGAWLVADASADPGRFAAAVYHSLDRKVCNTLNVCCIPRSRSAELVPVLLAVLGAAGERLQTGFKLHVAAGEDGDIPPAWRTARTKVMRADGEHVEPLVEPLGEGDLAREWEWEGTPEISLKLVADTEEAAALFNRFSPRFAASLIAEDPAVHERFWQAVDAPFVGDGFTRWVDGQYALNRPELGLSNWQSGRLFARGGVLSGDGVFTLRARAFQADPDLDRGAAPAPAPPEA